MRVLGLPARIVPVVLLALLLTAAAARGDDEPAGAPAPARYAPRRVIVEWRSGVTSADRVETRADADTSLVHTLGAPAFQLVRTDPGQSVGDALAALRADPDVKLAVRDVLYAPQSLPNDPLLGQLWGLQNSGLGIAGVGSAVAGADIDAPAAWDRTVGSPSVVLADIDSGYRFTDGDLGPVAWTNPGEVANGLDDDHNGIVDDLHGADFVGPDADAPTPTTDGDPTDDNLISGGHGLHTAGTMGAAGNNGIGITGVAQNVRIMPLRVCANSADASNSALCPASSQVNAINYAGAHGARVANMSLGGTAPSPEVLDAIAENPQTLFVISAGNDAQNNDPGGTPHYPCVDAPQTSGIPGAIDNVICVAATDQSDHLASFSDWGATSVDLGAPGTETLSTFPAMEDRFIDTFEVNDFSTNWIATGADGGFARTSESPLTSFGMSDSPGVGTPVANTVRESTSKAIAIPSGYGSCTLTQTRHVSTGGGDSYVYSVLSGSTPVFTSVPITSSGIGTSPPIAGLAGTNVHVRVTFTAGSHPAAGHGVWLDDLGLTCYKPASAPLTYAFLDGTSMAAPHVTGAAGLLFSLKPSASVSEVRNALLTGVTPDPSLAGKTTTGGRLDVARAMSVLVPPDTQITAAPGDVTTSTLAAFAFRRADSLAAATFECRVDAGAYAPCVSGFSATVGVGGHTFDVRAKDAFGRVDPTPAQASWTVAGAKPRPRCRVPRLAGKSLTQARRALTRAHCRLGKVTKPRARRHHKPPPLVVKSSSPRAGAVRGAGAKVALTLKAKPRPKRARRR